MRSAYLAIICYLIGFIGVQRDRFETRVREPRGGGGTPMRSRVALHDGYVQVLAGMNLRLETCQVLMKCRAAG